MRVSVYIENMQSLSDDDLLRAIAACDQEIARCKVAAKTMSPLQKFHYFLPKLNKLKTAKGLFLLEQQTRQQIEC